MNLKLKIWRQAAADAPGRMVEYDAPGVSPHMSFLEMLDVLNERLVNRGEEPIAFDHDCREGICGTCGFVINGIAHGGQKGTTVCQLHMRHFNDGDDITVEPWRAAAFPIIKDLVVSRAPFDKIIQAGGYISAPTGAARDANSTLIPKPTADLAFDAAACIGCGACVAACPNGAAHLFGGSKLAHLALLPHGRLERGRRARALGEVLDTEFGPCSSYGECVEVCPAGIPLAAVAAMHRERLRGLFRGKAD